jgi:hypothetical protein
MEENKGMMGMSRTQCIEVRNETENVINEEQLDTDKHTG